MSGRLLYEDYLAQEEEQEEKTFDEIAAQTFADQRFLEENLQLPGAVEPIPQPAAPPPAQPAPQPIARPADRGPQPGPPPAAPSLLDEFFRENVELPPYDPFAEYVQNESPLTQRIRDEFDLLSDLDVSLSSMMGDEIFEMTSDSLESYYQERGIDPQGPLASLNTLIVEKNTELTDIERQLDALDPDNFTTQTQVDRYNNLVTRHGEVRSDLLGYLDEYQTIGQNLSDQYTSVRESLYGADGTGGLVADWDARYAPGGFIDDLYRQEEFKSRGVPNAPIDIDPELYSAIKQGYVNLDLTVGGFGNITPGEKLVEASREAREYQNQQRRIREQYVLGTTSEQISGFREDPGYQEFISQIVPAEASDELLEALGLQLGLEGPVPQIAARKNPYGSSDPSFAEDYQELGIQPPPIQTELVGPLSTDGPSTLDALGGLLGLVGTGIEQVINPPGTEGTSASRLLELVNIPGEYASKTFFSEVAGLKGFTEGFGKLRAPDKQVFQRNIATGFATGEVQPIDLNMNLTAPISEGYQSSRKTWKNYDDLPWWMTLTGEVLLDPLNFVTAAGVLRGVKGAQSILRGQKVLKTGVMKAAYDDAADAGLRADLDFIQATRNISNQNLGPIDKLKLTDSQAKFADVAKQSFSKLSDDEAGIFGARVGSRLHNASPEQWQRIMREEVERLASRNNLTLNERTLGKFAGEVSKQDATARLAGNEYWRERGGEFADVLRDTPQWRRARKLPDVEDVGIEGVPDTPRLNDLGAVGHSPDITLSQRHDDVADGTRAWGSKSEARIEYLEPQHQPLPQDDVVTDDMIQILERTFAREAERNKKLKPIDKMPVTLDDYWKEFRRITGEKSTSPFPAGRTVNDVVRDTRYHALVAHNRGAIQEGLLPRSVDRVVDTNALGLLVKYSYVQGRNLLDELANPYRAGTDAFTHARAWDIINNMPLTNSQRGIIRKIATKQGKSVSNKFLDSLNYLNGQSYIRRLRGKKLRKGDVWNVALHYSDDVLDTWAKNRELLGKDEYRAVFTDLLTPVGEGRYVFTASVVMPDGTTVAGWARMSDTEMVNMFRNAPRRIRELRNYGPVATQIGKYATFMARQEGDEFLGQLNPSLLNEARNLIDSLLDDVVDTADLAESRIFKNWLIDQYTKSALPSKLAVTNPRNLRPNAPELYQLKRGLNHRNVLEAERNAILQQQDQLSAISKMTEYVTGDGVQKLKWSEIVRQPTEEAIDILRRHFRQDQSPFTEDGFFNLLREMQFVGPGGSVVGYRQLVDMIGNNRNALARINREIASFTETIEHLATKLDVNPAEFQGHSIVHDIEAWVQKFGDSIGDYATYKADDISVPYRSPSPQTILDTRRVPDRSYDSIRRVLRDSTDETAYAMDVQQNPRLAQLYTKPVVGAEVFPERPVFFSRGAWGDSPAIQRHFARSIAKHNAIGKNTLSYTELASRMFPDFTIAADDYVSQALAIKMNTAREAAQKAGVKIAEVDRARRAANEALDMATGIHLNKFDRDAQRLRETADLMQDVVATESRRRGVDVGKIEIVGGKLRLPDGVVKAAADWLKEQQKLHIVKYLKPNETVEQALIRIRDIDRDIMQTINQRILGPALDYLIFGVTDPNLSSDLVKVLGPDAARFIRPRHQRPSVSVFDPMVAHLPSINWVQHGEVFDDLIKSTYRFDPVWGKSAGFNLDPRMASQQTDMSRGVKIGDLGSFVGSVVYGNVYNWAAKSQENLRSIYDEILNGLDEIVDGSPSATALYGEMFDSSEELNLWLKWARTKGKDGVRNWDAVRDGWMDGSIAVGGWADATPHFSISRMPAELAERIFIPTRQGAAWKGYTLRKHTLNRGMIADDIKALDDFISGKMDLSDLDDSLQVEAKLWRDALKDRWLAERTTFIDGINGGWKRGVHVDDLDAVFALDHLDPYDAQAFADNLGKVMTQREYHRLGFDPSKVPPLLMASQFIKHTLGYLWLRVAPRYIINNIYGNYVSIAMNNVRSGRARGVRKVDRVSQSMGRRGGSVQSHRLLDYAFTTTEFGRGGAQGEIARRLSMAKKDLSPPEKLSSRALSFVGNPLRQYTDFNAKITNFFELDARERVWTVEYDWAYTNRWTEELRGIKGLDLNLRENITGDLELSDIAAKLREAEVDSRIQQQVFAAHNKSLADAHLRAYHATREVMRDYLMRNRFDNLMDRVFPYHFWMTKNLLFVTGTVLDRPATAIQAMRVYDAWAETWDGMPYSFKRKLGGFRMPGFMPYLGGEEVWLRPNNMTNPAFFIVPAVVDEMRQAWERYEDMPVIERIARTTAGGMAQAWEEMGYSPGPHFDAAHGVIQAGLNTQATKKTLGEDRTEAFRDWVARGYYGVIKPGGFESEILPLGGLEDLGLALVGETGIPFTDETFRTVYAYGNQLVKGTPYTRFEVSQMGHILADMGREGELGGVEVTEHEDGTITYEISEEAKATFWELHLLVVSGRDDELENHPIGKKVVDRMRKDTGAKSGYNYLTALSLSVFGEGWELSEWANDEYGMRHDGDDLIPIPTGANKVTKLLVAGLNKQIEKAQQEQVKYLEAHGFSPDAIATANQEFELAKYRVYRDAQKAGIDAPQLRDEGPNTANKWAFGEYNPETGRYENAHAPWLMFVWAANDSPGEVEAKIAQNAQYQRDQQASENNYQIVQEARDRYGRAAPYFNRLDDVDAEERVKLQELDRSGLSENAKALRENDIFNETVRKKREIRNEAERAGVSLSGTGRLPRQTADWYDYQERFGNDLGYLYQEAGAMDSPVALKTLQQSAQLNDIQNQIQAHTEWTMRRVIDALDLNPYLEGGVPNPRFATDGYFNREDWENEVKRMAPTITSTYREFVRSWRQGRNFGEGRMTGADPGLEPVDLLARGITFNEFFTYATENVLSRQSAYKQGFDAQLDKVYNAEGGRPRRVLDGAQDLTEKERLILEGIQQFGPRFGDAARRQRIYIDMDDVAERITQFVDQLPSAERTAFEGLYSHLFKPDVDGERVIDAEELTYEDAQKIVEAYGIKLPLHAEEYQQSRAKIAIEEHWEQLSPQQKAQWKEALDADETFEHDVILTISGEDDETGAPYSHDILALDDLNANEIRALLRKFDIGVPTHPHEEDGYFREQLFPDVDEEGGVIDSRHPDFNRRLQQAAFDKETQIIKDDFVSGRIFLDSEDDVQMYQNIFAFRDAHPDIYKYGRDIIDETGVSWEWLAETLAPPESGEVNLQSFAEAYLKVLEDNEAPRLFNERRRWVMSAEGQRAIDRDSEFFGAYIDGRNPDAEDFAQQAEAGTLYGFQGEDLKNWQEFYDNIDKNDHLYSAAKTIMDNNDWTWNRLIEELDDGAIRDFAIGYKERIEKYDMPRLWDQRTAFWKTSYGQSIIGLDKDQFADNVRGESGGRSSGSGFGAGSSGSRSSGYGYSRQPDTGGRSINDFYSPIRDIFRLDTGMSTGNAADSQARFDVAIQIADFIQQKLQPLIDIFGENDQLVRLFAQNWLRWLRTVLGEEPTLALWSQALEALGIQEEPIVPSDELLEQEPLIAAD